MKSLTKNIGAGTFLLVATLVVNLSNYGLNLTLGRWLGPAGFSEANIIATIVMVLSFAAMGLQLAIAKLSAEGSYGIIAMLRKKVLLLSLFLSVLLMVMTPLISNFLLFRNPYSLMILFSGISSYLLMSLSRGYYQGTSDFSKLAWTYLLEMITRVLFTLVLLYYFSGKGMDTEIIAIGFLMSFILTHLCYRITIKEQQVTQKSLDSILRFLVIIALYELSQILINNSDVILVKHFFEPTQAGLYAAMALLGRAVFFATWTVVMILFPKVIEREKKGLPHRKLFFIALTSVIGISATMVLGSYLFGESIMQFAFGTDYEGMSEYLWMYALLTTLFACSNVFVYYNLSLEKYFPVFASLVIGAIQIVMLYLFHSSVKQVLYVQLGLMVYMLFTMSIYQFIIPLIQEKVQIKLSSRNIRIAKQNF